MCDRAHKKSTFTSHADWTDSSTHNKANNREQASDAFKIKQKDLGSKVLDQTDHSQHLPMQKTLSEAML